MLKGCWEEKNLFQPWVISILSDVYFKLSLNDLNLHQQIITFRPYAVTYVCLDWCQKWYMPWLCTGTAARLPCTVRNTGLGLQWQQFYMITPCCCMNLKSIDLIDLSTSFANNIYRSTCLLWYYHKMKRKTCFTYMQVYSLLPQKDTLLHIC